MRKRKKSGMGRRNPLSTRVEEVDNEEAVDGVVQEATSRDGTVIVTQMTGRRDVRMTRHPDSRTAEVAEMISIIEEETEDVAIVAMEMIETVNVKIMLRMGKCKRSYYLGNSANTHLVTRRESKPRNLK
jgi:hypothetical protein